MNTVFVVESWEAYVPDTAETEAIYSSLEKALMHKRADKRRYRIMEWPVDSDADVKFYKFGEEIKS